MKFLILMIAFTFIQPPQDVLTTDRPRHDSWNVLLQEYVLNNGDVKYKQFKNQEAELKKYIAYLGKFTPSDSWSQHEKLAYYINLYNAGTIALILENYPLESIKDINRPWGKKRLRIGKDSISLGDLEHKILRKMNEPRIHFAINCASYSCPKLLNEAYTPAKMEKQLKAVTVNFINDSSKNKITANRLELSAIFKWYKGDFMEKRSLITYLQPYTKVTLMNDAKITYLPYDWRLNEEK
ncbi:DUF547 domain-containing protein [Muriicola sp.]|uniref:DUF547 domain-containing protein n=1 Tax=Muriicola sp. TaxID=2020856 RepID=UPI003C76ECEC